MREAHLIPESEMSSDELVKRATLAAAADPPPLPLAKRLRRRQRLVARMAHYVPSERNRRIFEQVVIHHKPQADVAFRERLSRQRIGQIVERMRDWFAFWGGDDAAYAPDQKQRLATHVAIGELTEFQRQIQKAIVDADCSIQGDKFCYDHNGDKVRHERSYQKYPRPTSLYKMLLTAILARAKLAGAGGDAGYDLGAGASSQSMVVKTEINVNQSATQSPPKGALHSDIRSEMTSVDGPRDPIDGTTASQRS
ncbi:MAG TPA: hypothetical protein VMP01_05800 [Pirellulaceae bacterium]|nr:hypothetical protein [Pirellulaceae bacterium]